MVNWTKTPIRVVSSPKKFNFSQFIKLIKLNHKDQFIITQQQKPIDQFWKKLLKTTKTSIFSLKCMKKCMKNEINWKRKGKRVLPVYEDKNTWKNLRENNKNLDFESRSVEERERKAFWKNWNSDEHVKSLCF